MAKVIRVFRERYHDMKRYNVGDDYPEDDKERVAYLVKEGFLAEPEASEPEKETKKRKKGADTDGDLDAQ